jgi:hypothetical protein
VEVMFNVPLNDYGGPSMSSFIRVLGIVYGIIGDVDVIFCGKIVLRSTLCLCHGGSSTFFSSSPCRCGRGSTARCVGEGPFRLV